MTTDIRTVDLTDVETDAAGPARDWRVLARWLRSREALGLGCAVVIGLALRLFVTRSIWVDEAISIGQAQMAFPDMIRDLAALDIHPPLYATVLWLVVHVTGSTTESVVRAPSVLASMLTIVVLWGFARDVWDRRTALLVALVAAVAPLAVWYGQEARMYALWVLLVSVAMWAQARILRDGTGGRRAWIVFTVASIALAYTQWFAALPLLVMHAIFLGQAIRYRAKAFIRPWLISLGIAFVLVLPLVPYLISQARHSIAIGQGSTAPGQAGGDASAATGAVPDVYAVIANLLWGVFGFHSDSVMVDLGALWPILVLLCLGALGRGSDRTVRSLLLVGLVPPAVLFLAGFEKRMVFEIRYFTTLLPVLILLVGRLIATWGRGPVVRRLLPVVVISGLLWGLIDQQMNSANPRVYDFRGAVSWIRERSQPGDQLIYGPDYLDDELTYYSPGMPIHSTEELKVRTTGYGLPKVLSNGRNIFVLGSFLDDPKTSSQVGTVLAVLEHHSVRKVAEYHVANVTVWQFQEPTE